MIPSQQLGPIIIRVCLDCKDISKTIMFATTKRPYGLCYGRLGELHVTEGEHYHASALSPLEGKCGSWLGASYIVFRSPLVYP